MLGGETQVGSCPISRHILPSAHCLLQDLVPSLNGHAGKASCVGGHRWSVFDKTLCEWLCDESVKVRHLLRLFRGLDCDPVDGFYDPQALRGAGKYNSLFLCVCVCVRVRVRVRVGACGRMCVLAWVEGWVRVRAWAGMRCDSVCLRQLMLRMPMHRNCSSCVWRRLKICGLNPRSSGPISQIPIRASEISSD